VINFSKNCLICVDGRRPTLKWFVFKENTTRIFVHCIAHCKRTYSIEEYVATAGLTMTEFLQTYGKNLNVDVIDSDELSKLDWPSFWLSIHDPLSKKGQEYLLSRGLTLQGGFAYDVSREAIVIPFYYGDQLVGAQLRFIVPRVYEDGYEQKIDTVPGSRLGKLFYGWNQKALNSGCKMLVVVEGAFDAAALQQNLSSGANPAIRFVAVSGSNLSDHQIEQISKVKLSGIKTVLAPDCDEAGIQMIKKYKDVGCFTHVSITGDSKLDWNSFLKQRGKAALRKAFLENIRDVTK
jgi:DNA primase